MFGVDKASLVIEYLVASACWLPFLWVAAVAIPRELEAAIVPLLLVFANQPLFLKVLRAKPGFNYAEILTAIFVFLPLLATALLFAKPAKLSFAKIRTSKLSAIRLYGLYYFLHLLVNLGNPLTRTPSTTSRTPKSSIVLTVFLSASLLWLSLRGPFPLPVHLPPLLANRHSERVVKILSDLWLDATAVLFALSALATMAQLFSGNSSKLESFDLTRLLAPARHSPNQDSESGPSENVLEENNSNDAIAQGSLYGGETGVRSSGRLTVLAAVAVGTCLNQAVAFWRRRRRNSQFFAQDS